MAKNLELKVVLSAIDNMTAPIRGIMGQMGRLKGSYSKEMRSYNNTLKQTQNALRGLREAQAKTGAAGRPITQAMIEGEQALVRKIQDTNRAIDQRKAKMQQEMALINKRQAAMSRGRSMVNAGVMNIAKSGAMGYAGYKFMQEGIGFDSTMSKVQALARLDKDSDELKALRDQAKHLGKTWADPTQVAEGQSFYAMAGFEPDKILKAMEGTLDLARAADIEIGRAADIGSNILQGFGLDADQMDRVGDVLVGTFTRTNVDMEMLGDTMRYVAPIAHGLGVSLEETAAMTGILGNVGIQGTQAGTALRAIFSRLAAGPKMAKEALENIGIETSDEKGDLKKPIELLTEVIEKTQNMGNTERLNVLKSIAGEEAATAFMALTEKGNIQDIKRIYDEILNNQGESKKIADVMSDNLDGDIRKLSLGWTGFRLAVYEVNKNGLRKTVQYITGVVNKIREFAKANPKIVSFLSKAASIGITLLGTLGALTMAMGIFNMVVLANPIIFIIASIIAIITALILYEDDILDFFKNFAEAPALYIQKGIEFVLGLIDTISSFLGEIPFIGPLLKGAFDIATGAIKLVLSLINKILDAFIWIGDNWGEIKGWFADLWTSVKEMMQPLVDLFDAIIGRIKEMITGIKEFFSFEAPEWLKDTGSFVGNAASSAWDSTSGWVGGKWNGFWGDETPVPIPTAQPINNHSQNNTISVEINAGTNASASSIAEQTVMAIKSAGFGLIGDLR